MAVLLKEYRPGEWAVSLRSRGDADREAIDVEWIPLRQVQDRLTFPNERRIAQLAWERLAGEG